ncbi:unnamed protein product [Cuscuta epithymum]|uniref:Uncharacterized protein n=1 Tax=Cuscuta epithymum TaxID=186058 RepID=A0AAV0DLI3_9ASTE|nr:unnamed protein product [Cuscuta epithymum]
MVIIDGVNYERIAVDSFVIDNRDDISITLYNLIGYKAEEIAFEWSNSYVRIIGCSESNLTCFGNRIDRRRGIFGMGVKEIKLDDEQGTLFVKLSKQATTHKIDPRRTLELVQELLDQLSPSSSGGRKDSPRSNRRKGGGGGGSTAQKRINATELAWQEDDEISWRVVEKLKMGLKIVLVVIVSLGLFRLIEIQKSINQ